MTHSLKRSNPFGDQEKEDENEAAEEEILSPNSKRRRINCEHDDRANVLPTVMEVMGGGSSRKTGHTSYDINDNWDREERVQVLLQRYEKARSEISGSDKWDEEQRKVHKLIYMRGEHPMLDYSWRYNFRMWGVDTGVYAPEGTKKQLAIRSLKSEFKAAKALEDLFDLTLQVKRWIDLDQQAKIPRIIVKVLKRYISWAKQDAGVSHKDFPPVVIIRAYPLGFATGSGQVKIKVEEDDSTIFGATLLGVGEDRASATGEDAMVDRVSALHVDERPAVQRVSAVSEDIEQRLQDLAKRQRSYYADKEAGGNLTIRPPTLYAFAVVAHIAMLVSLDSITEDSPMVVLDTIDFSRVDQWLWNALSVALPVNMARDSMYARRDLWGYLGGTSVDLDDA